MHNSIQTVYVRRLRVSSLPSFRANDNSHRFRECFRNINGEDISESVGVCFLYSDSVSVYVGRNFAATDFSFSSFRLFWEK